MTAASATVAAVSEPGDVAEGGEVDELRRRLAELTQRCRRAVHDATNALIYARLLDAAPDRRRTDDLAPVIARAIHVAGAGAVTTVAFVDGARATTRVGCDAVELTHLLIDLLRRAVETGASRIAVTVAPAPGARVVVRLDDDGPGAWTALPIGRATGGDLRIERVPGGGRVTITLAAT